MGQKQIKVGKWTVDAAILRGTTLDEAVKLFPTKNKNRVETAWKLANPEREKPQPKAIAAEKGEAKEK